MHALLFLYPKPSHLPTSSPSRLPIPTRSLVLLRIEEHALSLRIRIIRRRY